MRTDFNERIGKTKYKYVSEMRWRQKNKTYFKGVFFENKKKLCYVIDSTAKGCALKLDKKLIELGRNPINVLKRM